MTQPLVSIIMPTYNSVDYLNVAVDSVLEQSYTNWELLIIDDGSLDATRSVLADYEKKDPRLRAFFRDHDGSIAHVRNFGLKQSRGRLIAFLDSDDWWDTEQLSTQVDFMCKNDCDFSFTNYLVVDELQNIQQVRSAPRTNYNYHQLLGGNPAGLLTVMLNRNSIGNDLFPEMHHEDYAFWLLLAKKGLLLQKCGNKNLAYYRLHHSSVSANKLKSSTWVWVIYRKLLKLSIVTSIKYFCLYAFRSLKRDTN